MKPMNIHVFQHVPFEGPGALARWAEARGGRLRTTRFWDDAAIPPLDAVDVLIAMGGPMSVNDEAALPWLREEKRFIRSAAERGIPVLGVCLGAQLIASAFGARVYRQPEREIGWFPIHGADVPAAAFRFPDEATAFHWHGETFDLPPGAVRLARSAACENQAFQLGDSVVGLQFHLESTPGGVAALVENCRDELTPGRYVQPETELLAAPASRYAAMHTLLERLLDHLIPGDVA